VTVFSVKSFVDFVPLVVQAFEFQQAGRGEISPKTRKPLFPGSEKEDAECKNYSAPRISCSPSGRELTPVDKKLPSSPVVVASQGSSLSHSAWNPRPAD